MYCWTNLQEAGSETQLSLFHTFDCNSTLLLHFTYLLEISLHACVICVLLVSFIVMCFSGDLRGLAYIRLVPSESSAWVSSSSYILLHFLLLLSLVYQLEQG